MATRTKIKISDDIELRRILDDEYEKSSQVKLCKYALLLATHILTTIEYDDMDNPIIKAGYAVNESWQKGKFVADRKFKTGFMITHSGRHLWKVSALQIQCTKRRGFCGITAFLSKTGEIIMHVLRF